MVERKRYMKPAVESEDSMEQTSLACTSTTLPISDGCDWGTNLATEAACETVPWKGGNFAINIGCSVFPPGGSGTCIIALS